MFTRKKKVGSNSSVEKPENRFLRAFRSNDAFQGSPISLENTDREYDYSEDQKMIRNAMLAAENQSAKALLAFRNHQLLC